MFSILETLSNELHLSIVEAMLITKFEPELSIQKQFYTPILFRNLFGAREVNSNCAKRTLLAHGKYFS